MITHHYDHPEWEQTLIATGPDHREQALDMLSHEADPSLLEYREVEMSEEDFEQLCDFDG